MISDKLRNYSIAWAGLATYYSFFGYSYLKGYLIGAGFNNAQIEISVQESIFQTTNAMFNAVKIIAKSNFLSSLFWPSVKYGFACAVIFGALAFLFFLARKYFKSKGSQPDAFVFDVWIKDWLIIKPFTLGKVAITALASFFAGFSFQYLLALFFITLFVFAWLVIALGNIFGQTMGSKLATHDICVSPDVETASKDSHISCTHLTLSQGKELIGKSIYSSETTIFFVTNEGAYEIDRNLRLLSFTKFLKRQKKYSENKQ